MPPRPEGILSIGSELQAARVSRGLSIDDVSDATFVRSAVVAAIERDDFGPSGGPAYARGHVQLIARSLQLDVPALMREFDRQVEGFDSAPIAEALVRHKAAEPELAARTGVQWGRLIFLLVLVGVVATVAAVLGHWMVAGR